MKTAFLIFSVVALAASVARADVLARYTFDTDLTLSDTDPNSSASAVSDGPGLFSTLDVIRGNPAPALSVNSIFTDGTTQATAVTANDYISFTLTPLGEVDLTSLTFDYANYSGDGTFPAVTFFVRSSADLFATNVAPAVTAAAGSAGTFANANISLAGVNFRKCYHSDRVSNLFLRLDEQRSAWRANR